MHFGFSHIKKEIPVIIKRIAVTAGLISASIGGYGLVANDNFFIKTGGICLMISVGLPPLFGVRESQVIKEETKNEE